MADADPETFKTRFHLDLLDRLLIYLFWKVLTSEGKTGAQCQQILARRLEKDRRRMDEFVGRRFPDPSVAAVYAEQVSEVIDGIEAMLAKLVEASEREQG